MKKVILFALVLAVHGVLLNSVLAQEKRYLVTFVKSQTASAGIRSATVVTVVNQSDHSCDVQVEWFDGNASAPRCTRDTTIPPLSGFVHFCSRSLPSNITLCSDSQAICSPQDFSVLDGRAIVSSSSDCSLIAIDARVYYTTPDDAAILGISNPKIVFFGEGNLGD